MLQPISKFITVKEIFEEVKSSSGFSLSAKDIQETRYRKGIVLGAGNDVVDKIKPNDTILFDVLNSYTMLIDGEPVTIIQEREVIGVF